jgi:hypothetical protein
MRTLSKDLKTDDFKIHGYGSIDLKKCKAQKVLDKIQIGDNPLKVIIEADIEQPMNYYDGYSQTFILNVKSIKVKKVRSPNK